MAIGLSPRVTRRLAVWAHRTMAARRYDFPVGGHDDPYMLRWWVIPRNPLFNVYLHRFLRDDEDRALHDHPWVSCSIILEGGYWEHLSAGVRVWRAPGSIHPRRATAAHRIALERDYRGLGAGAVERRRHATTLFITGPRIRRWGFHCRNGWVDWELFVSPQDKGQVGRGCGES